MEEKINERGKHRSNYSHSIDWLLDIGTTDHMTTCSNLLHNIRYRKPSSVKVANGSVMKIVGYGCAYISKNIIVHNVLFVRKCKSNILSVSRLTADLNCCIIFGEKGAVLMNGINPMRIGECKVSCVLYSISAEREHQKSVHICMSTNTRKEISDWHNRLGHPS